MVLPVARQQVQARDTQVGERNTHSVEISSHRRIYVGTCMTYLDLNLKDDHYFYDEVKDIFLSFLKIMVLIFTNLIFAEVPVR